MLIVILVLETKEVCLYFGLVSSTESDVNIKKALTALDSLSIVWKSDYSDKIKRDLFKSVVNFVVSYLSLHKPSKWDEQDMLATADEE